MLSFFPRDVLDAIRESIELVSDSEVFPTYICQHKQHEVEQDIGSHMWCPYDLEG